jgi:hypothetical protein
MAASAVLREILVRLGVDTQAPMTKKQLQVFEDSIVRVKKTMREGVEMAAQWGQAVALGAVAAAAGITKLTVDMGAQATEIERQAALLNLTRKEYQEWRYVSEQLGATQRDLADAFLQINDIAQRAIDGSGEGTAAFQRIGLAVDKLKGKNPSQLFDLIADAVQNAADKGKAMAAVSQLLGEEAARQFGPALVKGAAGIRAMREEAEKLGVVMSDEQLVALQRVSTQWKRSTGILKGLRNELAVRLAPAVERILKGWTEWIEANRKLIAQRIETWVTRAIRLFESLDRAVKVIGGWDVVLLNVATGAGMLLLLANLDKVKDLLFGLRLAWAAAMTAATAASAATGIALLPLTLIVFGLITAIGLLALGLEDLWVWFHGGNSLLGRNLDLIESLIPAFGGFRDLLWALVEGTMASVTNLGLFADAIRNGLAPALQLIDPLLRPIIDGLRELVEWWAYGNAIVGSGLSDVAAWVRQGSAAGTGNAEHLAAQLQARLSGAVQGQVDRVAGNVQNIDNSSRSGTVNQTNHFGGGPAVRDVASAIESAARRALPIAQGGRR